MSFYFCIQGGNIHLSVFQSFLSCSLIRSHLCQVRIIVLNGSPRHRTFVPGSMLTELVCYGTLIYTIISIKSIFAASLVSRMFSCGSFHTFLFFGSRACPTVISRCLHASSIRSPMPLIVSFKSPEFSNWILMSIVSFIGLVCYEHVFNSSHSSLSVLHLGRTSYWSMEGRGTALHVSLWSLILYISLY